MPGAPRVSSRCAVHPARPAVDACPVCGRGRCGVDQAEHGSRGCAFCAVAPPSRPPAGQLELLVRAGLGGFAAALVGGWVGTQYVRVHLMSLLAPLLGGLAAAWATRAATGRAASTVRGRVLLTAAVAAVVGAALAFRVNAGGGLSPLHPLGRVGPPYLAALLGVAVWPLVFGVPRRPPGDQSPDADGEGEGEGDSEGETAR